MTTWVWEGIAAVAVLLLLLSRTDWGAVLAPFEALVERRHQRRLERLRAQEALVNAKVKLLEATLRDPVFASTERRQWDERLAARTATRRGPRRRKD